MEQIKLPIMNMVSNDSEFTERESLAYSEVIKKMEHLPERDKERVALYIQGYINAREIGQ